MNSTIWKFQFNPDDVVQIPMPVGADILTVEMQDNVLAHGIFAI